MMLLLFLPGHGQHVVHHPTERLHALISEGKVIWRLLGMQERERDQAGSEIHPGHG